MMIATDSSAGRLLNVYSVTHATWSGYRSATTN